MVVNLHRLCAVLRLRIFLGAALTLSWAGRLAATELDLPVFSGGYGTAFYEETARQFEALRPGVTVRVYGGPRITDQLRVRIIDGHYPDAALPRDLLLPPLVRAGKVVDLTPYLDGPNWEGDARWRDTFLPGALDAWRVDGGIYGVPLSYACWTIFYNRGLFRAHGWTEPRTWEAFFALCEKIRSAGIAPLSLTGIDGNYPGALLRSAYYDLAGAPGWRALNELRPGAYTDPRFIRSAALLQRITQHYTLRGWEGATHTAAQLAFLDGRAAMTVSGSWMVHEMAGKFPPGFELGAMNFPVFPEGVADPTTIQAGADSFFVFATGDPERERLTIDFLRYLTSRARAEAFVRRQDAPVAVRGVPLAAFSSRMRATAAMIAAAGEAFNMPQAALQVALGRLPHPVAAQAPLVAQAVADGVQADDGGAAALDQAAVGQPAQGRGEARVGEPFPPWGRRLGDGGVGHLDLRKPEQAQLWETAKVPDISIEFKINVKFTVELRREDL